MREKFKHFCDTANPDLLRLVIIFVLVGLLLVGFLLFGRSDEGASILPAWVQTEHVEHLLSARAEYDAFWFAFHPMHH